MDGGKVDEGLWVEDGGWGIGGWGWVGGGWVDRG